jgi:4-hydroxythreonine-4-phosphate dehydrogenase
LKPIIITEGDPTGISYELLDKSISELKRISLRHPIILVSSQNQIQSKKKSLYKEYNPQKKITNGLFEFNNLVLQSKKKISLGKPSELSGKFAYQSLITAIDLQKKIGGNIITLPLSKEWVIRSGIKNFQGHTEVFAEEYKVKTFMLMYSETLKVIPMTTHIPLKDVSNKLKNFHVEEFVQTLKKLKEFKNVSLGICGLNPHAGENGKMGNEEQTILLPMIKKIRSHGIKISEPIPADSIFIPEISKKYTMILACYHDQGLIPFKSMIGKKGINRTLGMDFIRVSPDHGTAFDIAGKNIAANESFLECLKLLEGL